MHVVPAWAGLAQSPQDGDVAEEHECKCGQDHDREHFVEVRDVSQALQYGVHQRDEPHDGGADRTMAPVLQVREDDRMAHGHVAVQTDACQEERWWVLDAVEEAQDVPGAAGGQVYQVGQLQRWDEAEEGVQHCQVPDEDIWCGRVVPVVPDQPQDYQVSRDAHEHVNKLHAQVEDDDLRHVAARLVHCLFTQGGISSDEPGVKGVIMRLHHSIVSDSPNIKSEMRQFKYYNVWIVQHL